MENINLDSLVGEKEAKAFEDYIKLTSYNDLIYFNHVLVANADYASRDMTFPVGLAMKE